MPWLVEAPNALVRQSRCDARGLENADGWGIAWYGQADGVTGSPARLRSVRPAHEDPEYVAAARRAAGEIVLAHVRRASVGAPTPANCHPFILGSWSFAHNGGIPGFEQLEPRLLEEISPNYRSARQGQTDSECLFLWLLHGWEQTARCHGDEVEAWAAHIAQAFGKLERLCAACGAEKVRLTFVASDGRRLLAVRWGNSLWWARAEEAQRGSAPGRKTAAAVLVASEPLSQHGWRELPEQSMLTVDAALCLCQRAL